MPISIQSSSSDMSTMQVILLSVCLAGIQFAWTIEFAYGTPFLVSIGLPPSLTALVWLAGPLSGLVMQPLIGLWSDKCTHPLVYGLLVILAICLIAFCKELAGVLVNGDAPNLTIALAVLAFYLLDFSINAVMASCRALIVDIAPHQQQGLANAWAGRMIGIGNVAGYFMGYLDLSHWFPGLDLSQLQVLCIFAIIWFVATIGLTAVYSKETEYHPIIFTPSLSAYQSIAKVFGHMRDLPVEIQEICNVQFCAWLGWFPFLFYCSSWVASVALLESPDADPTDSVRSGSFALLLFAIMSLVTGFVLPYIHSITPYPLTKLWAYSFVAFACLLFASFFATSLSFGYFVTAAIGVCWGLAIWIPFALIGEIISASEASVDIVSEVEPDMNQGDDSIVPAIRSLTQPLESGIILGIHNVYIVLPQFVSTFACSAVFTIVSFAGFTGENSAFSCIMLLSSLAAVFASVLAFNLTDETDYKSL